MQSRKLQNGMSDGAQVCLSLLGTWSGPGWDPKSSNVLQVAPHAGAHCARCSTVQIISNVMRHVRPSTVQRAIYEMHVAECNTDRATYNARHTQSNPHDALPRKPPPMLLRFRAAVDSALFRALCLSAAFRIDPRRDPCCAPVACISLGCSSVWRTLCLRKAMQGKAARSVPVAQSASWRAVYAVLSVGVLWHCVLA